MVGVLFIVGWIIFYFYTTNQSNKEHLEKKIEELKKEKLRAQTKIDLIQHGLNENSSKLDDKNEFSDAGYTSEKQYNDAIDEIERSVKYSPLERIYYEAELPDQLFNSVSLKQKTTEHLTYLQSKGTNLNDINAAKHIIQMREDIVGVKLNFEGFVIATINFKGKYITQEIYEGLIAIFKTAGREIDVSTNTLYNKLFSDLPF